MTIPTGKMAEVHLRVPSEMKDRWVRLSRQAGQKLTDWVVQRVDKKRKAGISGFFYHDDF